MKKRLKDIIPGLDDHIYIEYKRFCNLVEA